MSHQYLEGIVSETSLIDRCPASAQARGANPMNHPSRAWMVLVTGKSLLSAEWPAYNSHLSVLIPPLGATRKEPAPSQEREGVSLPSDSHSPRSAVSALQPAGGCPVTAPPHRGQCESTVYIFSNILF